LLKPLTALLAFHDLLHADEKGYLEDCCRLKTVMRRKSWFLVAGNTAAPFVQCNIETWPPMLARTSVPAVRRHPGPAFFLSDVDQSFSECSSCGGARNATMLIEAWPERR
jgi:hypothetical protein